MALHTPSIQTIYGNRQLTSPLVQSVLLIIIIVLLGWFIVRPEFVSSRAQHAQLEQASQKRAAIENEKQELERLVSQLQTSAEDIKITDEALPLVGRISRLDVLIESLARSSGLQVAQINAANTGDTIAAGNKAVLSDPYGVDRKLQTSSVSVLLSGNVDQFRTFLQLLETSGRVLDVSGLEVTSEPGATKFRVTIKAYAYETGSITSE